MGRHSARPRRGAFLLSLGPVARIADQPVGGGLHRWLYPVLLPLDAVRFVTRFGILVVFVGAFLAGFGVKWLEERLPPRAHRPFLGALVVWLLLEYTGFPSCTDGSAVRRPVDVALGPSPARPRSSSSRRTRPPSMRTRCFGPWRTGIRRQRLRRIRRPVARGTVRPPHLDGPAVSPPGRPDRASSDYPLRYLVVRLTDSAMSAESRQAWLGLRDAASPDLRFRGTFEDTDLYELLQRPAQGVRIDRMVRTCSAGAPSSRLAVRPWR